MPKAMPKAMTEARQPVDESPQAPDMETASLTHCAYELLARLGQRLDFASLPKAAEILGAGLWATLASRRRLAVRSLEERLGLSPEDAKRMARANFTNTAASFLEICLTRQVDERFLRDRLVMSEESRRRMAELRDRSSPLVLVTAHLGAWELMIGLLHLLLPGRPRLCVVRRPKDLALHAAMTHLRSRSDVEIIEHRRAAMTVLRRLRRNGAAAFLTDHNCGQSEAVFLPVLGKVAAVNMGPALLALRARAPVIPVFLLRREGGHYEYVVEQPLETSGLTGEINERVRSVATFYTQAMERAVRRDPEQWYWMHKRWKTRPPDEAAER